MDKYVVHIYNGILLRIVKNEIMPYAATWMEDIVILREDRKREISIGVTYLHNLKRIKK